MKTQYRSQVAAEGAGFYFRACVQIWARASRRRGQIAVATSPSARRWPESHIWMSHVTYDRAMSCTNEAFHIWMSHVTYECVISHMWSHVAQMNVMMMQAQMNVAICIISTMLPYASSLHYKSAGLMMITYASSSQVSGSFWDVSFQKNAVIMQAPITVVCIIIASRWVSLRRLFPNT